VLLLLLLLLLRLFEPVVLDPLSSIDMVMAVRFPGIGRVPVFLLFCFDFPENVCSYKLILYNNL
jgi:hypothetical protein